MSTRDASVDIAKGLAITAIVASHVMRGLAGAGVISGDSAAYVELDTALYLVHVPAFFFLSGVFVAGSARRLGWRAFAVDRTTTFLWVYGVWTLLQGAAKVLSGSLANTPWTVSEAIAQLWLSDSQLWFVPTLAAMTAATALWRPWESAPRAASYAVAALGISLAVWGVFGTVTFAKGWGVAAAFAAGVLVGRERLLRWLTSGTRRTPVRVAAVAVAATAAYAFFIWIGDPTPPSESTLPRSVVTVALGVAGTTAGVIALLSLSRWLAPLPAWSTAWGSIGRASLVIFVAHITVVALVRVVLLRWGVDDPAPHFVAGIAAGVVFPWLLAQGTTHPALSWLAQSPRWLTLTRTGR